MNAPDIMFWIFVFVFIFLKIQIINGTKIDGSRSFFNIRINKKSFSSSNFYILIKTTTILRKFYYAVPNL